MNAVHQWGTCGTVFVLSHGHRKDTKEKYDCARHAPLKKIKSNVPGAFSVFHSVPRKVTTLPSLKDEDKSRTFAYLPRDFHGQRSVHFPVCLSFL